MTIPNRIGMSSSGISHQYKAQHRGEEFNTYKIGHTLEHIVLYIYEETGAFPCGRCDPLSGALSDALFEIWKRDSAIYKYPPCPFYNHLRLVAIGLLYRQSLRYRGFKKQYHLLQLLPVCNGLQRGDRHRVFLPYSVHRNRPAEKSLRILGIFRSSALCVAMALQCCSCTRRYWE